MDGLAQALLPAKGDTPIRRARSPSVVFFGLGASSCISFNCLALSVAYFKMTLGSGVLSLLLTAHSSTMLATMFLVLVALPRSVSLRTYLWMLSGALAFGTCFNVFLLASLLLSASLPAQLLLSLVAVNGCATGLVQALGASLGGALDGGNTISSDYGSYQLAGVGFAQLLPCLLQTIFLPIAAQSGRPEYIARLSAIASAAVAATVCLLAVFALQSLSAAAQFKEIREPLDEGKHFSIGKCLRHKAHRSWLLKHRLLKLFPLVVLTLGTEGSFIFLMVISPAVPVPGTGAGGGFLKEYLPTMLLIAANSGAFAGRSVDEVAGIFYTGWGGCSDLVGG